MTLPPKLQREVDELAVTSYKIEVIEDQDFINLVFKAFPLGEGYSAPESDLLLMVPRSYPDAGPDMFWLNPAITLASGQIPQSADSIENHLNKNWRRFSWHRQGSPWNPTIENIASQIEFIHRRLREKK
jgi:hypothetical protein